jgi:hypothetical protein
MKTVPSRSSRLLERLVSNTTGITTNIVVIGAKRNHGQKRKNWKRRASLETS